VGRILAEDLRAQGVVVAAYDRLLAQPEGDTIRLHAAWAGVMLAAAHAKRAGMSDFVISAVTAGQALAVAEVAAAGISVGSFP
jgi:hypothetical protein